MTLQGQSKKNTEKTKLEKVNGKHKIVEIQNYNEANMLHASKDNR